MSFSKDHPDVPDEINKDAAWFAATGANAYCYCTCDSATQKGSGSHSHAMNVEAGKPYFYAVLAKDDDVSVDSLRV